MLSVLFVGLSGHLRGGVEVWRRTTQTVEDLQRQRVALDQLEGDLARAVRYLVEGDTSLLPTFEADRLRWWTVAPVSAQQPGITLVTYACGPVDGGQGLWRESRSINQARAGIEVTRTLILPACESLLLQYAYLPSVEGEPLAWQPEWEFPNELPRLLEVSVRLSSGQEVKRVMAIPIGVLRPYHR
jgi:hypothetical protein